MDSTGRLLEPRDPRHGTNYMEPPSIPMTMAPNTPDGPESSRPFPDSREPMKPLIYKGLRGVVFWPIPALISVAGTAILLYLNFSEYSIGGQIGTTTKATANSLGALQIAVKLHELFIVASLAAIAHQWILGDLMIRGGTLFGLLGADLSLADPTFLVSKNYMAALSYGFRGTFRSYSQPAEKIKRRRVFLLAGFLCIACAIASMAGPASAVLMIPRIDWFFQERLERFHRATDGIVSDTGYPNILIVPQYSHRFSKARNQFAWNEWDYFQTGVQYFGEIGAFLKTWDGETRAPNKKTTHRTHDYVGDVLFNATTTWDRTLTGNWTGGTSISTVLRLDIKANSDYLIRNRNHPGTGRWRDRKYVVDLNALESWIVCHSDPKAPCDNTSSESSEWCYKSPGNNSSALRHSKNLLLVRNQQNGTRPDNRTSFFYPRVWMTEGPRLADSPKFSDSVEVIFEGDYKPEIVTVCSISTKLKAATATLFDNSLSFNARQVEYYDYVTRTDGTRDESPTLLFYEQWLDGYSYGDKRYNGSLTFPPRNQSDQVNSGPLRGYADSVRSAIDSQDWSPQDKAGILETVVGGAFLDILSWMTPSTSQYAIPRDVTLPDDLMPEPRKTYAPLPMTPINVYTEGYGFRFSTRTGNLSIAVLSTHAFIAVSSVIWQLFYKRRVIKAWSTVPEYTALGIGSTPRAGVLENTCAGISKKETLGNVVIVAETTPSHLEVIVQKRGLEEPKWNEVGLEKYGFYSGGCRERKKVKLD